MAQLCFPHFRYIPCQRAIISQINDVLFTIYPESIWKMIQVKASTPMHPFSIDSLMEVYKKLTFPQTTKIFEILLPKNVELARKILHTLLKCS